MNAHLNFPFYYLLNTKKFNLTALLKSGQFYLDDAGLLVAPNGTRYRIPSGPPEGRKPLRPVQPKPQYVKPISTLAQQDSNRVASAASDQIDHVPNHTVFTKLQDVNSKASLRPSVSPSTDIDSVTLSSVDWNVILLSLILSSISLACNIGLLIIVPWICRRARKLYNGLHTGIQEREIKQSDTLLLNETSRPRSEKMHHNYRRASRSTRNCNESSLSASTWRNSNQHCSVSDTESFVVRSQRTRRRLPNQKNGRMFNSERLPNTALRCSSSENSCIHAVSERVLSETSTDERSSTEDSETNPDALVKNHRNFWKRNPVNRTNECTFAGESFELIATPTKPHVAEATNLSKRGGYPLDTIRSKVPTTSISEESFSDLEIQKSNPPNCSNLFVDGILVFQSLGIHAGLLGTILSLIQLLVITTGLSKRIIRNNVNQETQTLQVSDILCALSTSVAADTLVCARQYLISALLFVFWTTFSTSVSNYVAQSKNITACSQAVPLNIWVGLNTKTSHLRSEHLVTNCRQQCAYMALLHSLPWALAAGTALLVTFAVPTRMQYFENHVRKKRLNFFFKGLETILTCTTVEAVQELSNNQSTHIAILKPTISVNPIVQFSYEWIPPFLLLLLPFLLHLLICFVHTVLLRLTSRELTDIQHATVREREKIFCKSLCPVFLLVFIEFSSCTFPFLWSLIIPRTFQHHTSSGLVNRLILVHLLVDPIFIVGMMHSLNKVKNKRMMRVSKERTTNHSFKHSDEHIFANTDGGQRKTVNPSSPTTLLNCLPITNRTPAYGKAISSNTPLLVSCFPGTDYIFPRLSVTTSETLPGSLDRREHLLISLTDPTYGNNRFPPTTSTSITIETSHSTNQSKTHKPKTAAQTEAFPQLCQRHQEMLQQHYRPKISKSYAGHVPRMPNSSTKESQLLKLSKSVIKDPDDPLNSNSSENHENLPRLNIGNSVATATVMAAAAAAVAAQAGNLAHQ